MMWFIIGVIDTIITYYIHKHTYRTRRRVYGHDFKYVYEDRMPCPLWLLILVFIVNVIPSLGIIMFMIGFAGYILFIFNGDIYFKPTGIVKEVFNILSKEI